MAKVSESTTFSLPGDSSVAPKAQAKGLVHDYLLEHLPIYRYLRELQRQASTNQLFHPCPSTPPLPASRS
jgi:hypothetical protein